MSEADAGVQGERDFLLPLFFLVLYLNLSLGNRYLEETSDSEVEEKVEGENTTLRIDEWTVFRRVEQRVQISFEVFFPNNKCFFHCRSDMDLAHLALQMRQKWASLFLRRLNSPGKPMTQVK